jgi:hypothetical protein
LTDTAKQVPCSNTRRGWEEQIDILSSVGHEKK